MRTLAQRNSRHSVLVPGITTGPIASSSAAIMFSFLRGKKKQWAPSSTGVAVLPVEQQQAENNPTTSPQTDSSTNSPKVLKLSIGSCCLPHPEKIHYGGEDAHFVSSYGGGAMGVADGVGGWQESGVNPADYSRGLMNMAKAYLEGVGMFTAAATLRQGVLIDPRGALDAAHLNTKVPGSATACVMQIDQSNHSLVAANLGDSGFLVIRDGKELVKSRPLQHYFDCPLQFGAFPEYVEATDTADMADLYTIALQPGDVIVAGSDGLWDNCFVSEIINLCPRTHDMVERAAVDVAHTARRHAADGSYPSPYTREALAQGLDLPWWDKLLGMSFKGGKMQLKQLTGGKMDDITVLVAMVVSTDPPPPPAAPLSQAEPTATALEAGESTSNVQLTVPDHMVEGQ